MLQTGNKRTVRHRILILILRGYPKFSILIRQVHNCINATVHQHLRNVAIVVYKQRDKRRRGAYCASTTASPPFLLGPCGPLVPPCQGWGKSLCRHPPVLIVRHCVCTQSGPTTLKHPQAPLCAPKQCALRV